MVLQKASSGLIVKSKKVRAPYCAAPACPGGARRRDGWTL